MRKVNKMILEIWISGIEDKEEKKYFQKKLRELNRKKLTSIIIECIPNHIKKT